MANFLLKCGFDLFGDRLYPIDNRIIDIKMDGSEISSIFINKIESDKEYQHFFLYLVEVGDDEWYNFSTNLHKNGDVVFRTRSPLITNDKRYTIINVDSYEILSKEQSPDFHNYLHRIKSIRRKEKLQLIFDE